MDEDDTEAQKTALALATPYGKSLPHMRWNVRFGSLADVSAALVNVCSWGNSRHSWGARALMLTAFSTPVVGAAFAARAPVCHRELELLNPWP